MSGNNRRGLMACGFCLVLLVTGCGGSGSKGFSNTSQQRSTLVRTWIKRSVSYGNRSVTCPNSIDGTQDHSVSSLTLNSVVIDACGYNEMITFNQDGTYEYVIPAPRFVQMTTEDGTFTVSGNTITLTRTSIGYDTNGDGVIQNNEKTSLASVTSATSIPPNPKQRVVLNFSVSDGMLTLTTVPQSTTDVNGNIIVNSDNTVNAVVPGTTVTYGAQ